MGRGRGEGGRGKGGPPGATRASEARAITITFRFPLWKPAESLHGHPLHPPTHPIPPTHPPARPPARPPTPTHAHPLARAPTSSQHQAHQQKTPATLHTLSAHTEGQVRCDFPTEVVVWGLP